MLKMNLKDLSKEEYYHLLECYFYGSIAKGMLGEGDEETADMVVNIQTKLCNLAKEFDLEHLVVSDQQKDICLIAENTDLSENGDILVDVLTVGIENYEE